MPDPVRTRPDASRRATELGAFASWPLLALASLFLAACSGEAPLPGDPLRLVASSIPDPVVGEPYQQDLTPTGGLRPYTFTLEEGRVPPGLSLQGGTLIGTPTELGRYEFTVSVSDANLSSTYATYTVTVRDLPVPVLDLAVPETEVRGDTQIRVGVRDARALRGVRVWIDWENPSVTLAAGGVRASRDDIALFRSEREGGIAVDVVVLGGTLTGDHELFRLDFRTEEAVVLGMDVRTEFLYGGRHAFSESRVGAPRPVPNRGTEGEGDEGGTPVDPPEEGPTDAGDDEAAGEAGADEDDGLPSPAPPTGTPAESPTGDAP